MADIFLDKITVRFKDVVALYDFKLKVKDGEFIALLGPSGCGKTTCLRTVAGFTRPDHGNVYIGSQKVNNIPPYKRNIGIVFQNYALFPHKNVFGNIAFGLRMTKVNRNELRNRVDSILKLLHLLGLENRYPSELSGGQQQRVALARALVTMPSVLLLDEPLGALDKKLREEMQIELRTLQKRLGITTIFVTHDQEEALTMADNIVIMDGGKIKQKGKPMDVYNSPRSEFVAEFIGIPNLMKLKVERIEEKNLVCRFGKNFINLPKKEEQRYEKEIQIAIRPEKIVINNTRNLSNDLVNIPGIIKNIVFKGSFILYYVGISEEKDFVIQKTSNHIESNVTNIDDNVYLSWKVSDTLILGND